MPVECRQRFLRQHRPVGAADLCAMGNAVPPLAAFLFIATTFLCGCGSSMAREASAKVLKADGLNFVSRPKQGSNERPLKEKSPVTVGETIHSGGDGRVALSLLPGALLQLEPNSTLTIEQLKITKDGNATEGGISRGLRIRLSEGAIVVIVDFEPQSADWGIATPHGELSAASAGLCRLEVTAAKTRLTSVRGEFAFRAREQDHKSRVEAGYVQEWPSPQSCSIPGGF